MKKNSLLIFFCFLFQGCFTLSFAYIGNKKKYATMREPPRRNKDCVFEEFMQDAEAIYQFRLATIGSIIDLGLVINYYFRFHTVGLQLFGLGIYALVPSVVLINFPPPFRTQEGWNDYSATECKDDYFVIEYEDKDLFRRGESLFLKGILNYPLETETSQDKNFSQFQKNFLPNIRIQTYSKGNYFYRYIHYPGGKAKFEEDFGKYLYTNRQK